MATRSRKRARSDSDSEDAQSNSEASTLVTTRLSELSCRYSRRKSRPRRVPGRQTAPIRRFPAEVLTAIFSFLSPVDLGVVARVCSRWKTLVYHPSMWRHTVSLNLDTLADSAIASLKDRQLRRVTIVSVSDATSLTNLLNGVPSLEYIHLKGPYTLSSLGVINAFSGNYPSLKELHLRWVRNHDGGSLFAQMTNLETLVLYGDGNLSSLQGAASHLRQLRTLEQVSWAFAPTPLHSSQLAIFPMEHLLRLCLRTCQVSDAEVQHLQQGLPNLSTLCVILADGFSEAGMQTLARMTSLQELTLDGRKLQASWFRHLCEGLSNLATLRLYVWETESYRIVRHLSRLPHLEDLHMHACQSTTLRCFRKGFPQLKRLHLCGAFEMSDENMAVLSRFTQLEHLHLPLDEVSAEAVAVLNSRLRKLRCLRLCGLQEENSETYMHHIADMPLLQRLYLFDCSLDEYSLHRLWQSDSLVRLILHSCTFEDELLDDAPESIQVCVKTGQMLDHTCCRVPCKI